MPKKYLSDRTASLICRIIDSENSNPEHLLDLIDFDVADINSFVQFLIEKNICSGASESIKNAYFSKNNLNINKEPHLSVIECEKMLNELIKISEKFSIINEFLLLDKIKENISYLKTNPVDSVELISETIIMINENICTLNFLENFNSKIKPISIETNKNDDDQDTHF